MTDPIRLIESGELSPFENELLRSAQLEEPSERVNAVLLAGIGAAGMVPSLDLITGPGQSMLAPSGYGLGLWKWISGIGVSGALAAGLLAARSPSEAPVACEGASCGSSRSAPLRVDEQALAAPVQAEPAESALPQGRSERSAPLLPPPVLRPASKATKESGAKAVPTSPSLTEEVVALEPARVALRKGEPLRALQVLTRYESRFPNGVLRPEAEALRAQARELVAARSSTQKSR